MEKQKVVRLDLDAIKSRDLLSAVRAKITKEFGLTKTFTHWDFEELLGTDALRDRMRIAAIFAYLKCEGCLKTVGKRHNGQNRFSVYQVVKFPLGREKEVKAAHTPSITNLDNIFFNLGKKRNEKINLQLMGRTDGRPRQADY